MTHSFDQLVGPAKQRQREIDSERVGRFEIDDEFNFSDLLNRKIYGLRTLENAADVDAGQTIRFGDVAAVTHQATALGELRILVDRWHTVAKG